MADSELAGKLNRQQQINDGEAAPQKISQSVYAEFKEFSIPEIKEFRKTFVKLVEKHDLSNDLCLVFSRYDVDKSGFIDFMELKLMMEKLGEPQTHLGLKAMIKEVDEDHDNQISFREVTLSLPSPSFLHPSLPLLLSSFSFPPLLCIFFRSVSPHMPIYGDMRCCLQAYDPII